MDGSGVKLNLKALNHLVCNYSSLHFRFQVRSFLSTSPHAARARIRARKNNFLISPSLSFSSPTSRFSPLPSLHEKVNGSCSPSGVVHTMEQTSDISNGNNLLQVVLVSPQIPGNTGCIARTCAASGVKLHLVEPLGFEINDTKLKRAGLDYWPYVVVKVHPSWADFRDYFSLQEGEKRLLAFTKRGTALHSSGFQSCLSFQSVSSSRRDAVTIHGICGDFPMDISYRPGDWLVFGSETSGLPPDALLDCKNEPYGGGAVKIPMVDTYVRCLNLSVSVGIAVYEAARQLNYEQLQCSPETYINSENPFIAEDIFA